MKKIYEDILITFIPLAEDAITTSANDNVVDMPEFPETFF